MSTRRAPSDTPRRTSAERTRRWRERLRASGLIPKTVWTHDLKDAAFLAQLAAACAHIGSSPGEAGITLELERMADEDDLWNGAEAWSAEPSSSSS